MKTKSTYWICLLPLAIFLCYWHERPFQSALGETHSKLSHLSRQERTNIALACKKLDGYVIKPGSTFSFNHVVGPRTHERGFVSAPTYIGNSTLRTEGGGICLVSSLVYKAGLESGLSVSERTPHSRTVSSVPPGLDATVWYGRYDLKLKNTTTEPIKISCNTDPSSVSIQMFGRNNQPLPEILRKETVATTSQVAVTVFLKRNDQLELISRDLYDRRTRTTR